jgi:hypothetical protein
MGYNTKNYTEQGGEKTVIGGILEVKEGGSLEIKEGALLKGQEPMSATTQQAVIMLSSHFYESRDGSTGGFFGDNVKASEQVWNAGREWKV